MKYRIFKLIIIIYILLISFSAYAINFMPEETYNSVVVVYTETGVGSGFYIKDNIIITNAHVVGSDKTVAVNLYDGATIKGNIIKIDNDKDLALIEVEKSGLALSMNTGSLSIGQEVYAIGAPRDMPYTMTKGIISAVERSLGNNTYIQIDASVNSGNSGGPLVDESGQVIGIITLKVSDAEGIGFAIKAADINNFVSYTEYSDIPESYGGDSDTMLIPDNSEDNDIKKDLIAENERLKVIICIFVIFNIIMLSLCLWLLFERNKKKAKDEFDFEIEIED